jgi:hypothetical protein
VVLSPTDIHNFHILGWNSFELVVVLLLMMVDDVVVVVSVAAAGVSVMLDGRRRWQSHY